MKKIALLFVCMVSLAVVQAQSVGKATVEQYKQLMALNGKSFKACSDKLESWGFVYNKDGVVNMFTMDLHLFLRAEGEDTVAATIGVMDDVAYSTGGAYVSMVPARVYALIGQASAMQQRIADEMGLTKFVCSVKGKKVTNKFPKNHAELVEVLEAMSEETVSWVFEQWKSDDGKRTLTLFYDNKLFGKKNPRRGDRVELNLGKSVVQ